MEHASHSWRSSGESSEQDSGVTESWPQGYSRKASMRISDVLTHLRLEFPAVSHSKLRFLEEQGLINPVRTAAGYRQYCAADVERLRFVLTEQRDRYLPLKVIKEKLVALDAGERTNDHLLGPRLATQDGVSPAQATAKEFEHLADLTGVDQDFIDEMVAGGLIRPSTQAGAGFGARRDLSFEKEIVRLAYLLREHSIDWRHLRSMRAAADRQLAIIEQSIAPLQGKASTSAHAQAQTAATEMAELFAQLHTIWLRKGTREPDL